MSKKNGKSKVEKVDIIANLQVRKELEALDFYVQQKEPSPTCRPCTTCAASQACRQIAKRLDIDWSHVYWRCKAEIGYFSNYWREFT